MTLLALVTSCALLGVLLAATPALAGTAKVWKIASSGKCLDLPFADPADGVIPQQFTCHNGRRNQQWHLLLRTDGFYSIVSVSSGKCLDVPSSLTGDRVLVQQHLCHTGTNQQWGVNIATGAFFARHSGKCLDIRGGGLADGAVLQQFTCHGGLNQKWSLFSV